LVSDEKAFGYLFSNPHKVTLNSPVLLTENLNDNSENIISVTLSPWIVLSDDKEIIVSPGWVVTVVEPINSLKEMYEEKVNGKECEVSLTEG
jgi:hypothetical protein